MGKERGEKRRDRIAGEGGRVEQRVKEGGGGVERNEPVTKIDGECQNKMKYGQKKVLSPRYSIPKKLFVFLFLDYYSTCYSVFNCISNIRTCASLASHKMG